MAPIPITPYLIRLSTSFEWQSYIQKGTFAKKYSKKSVFLETVSIFSHFLETRCNPCRQCPSNSEDNALLIRITMPHSSSDEKPTAVLPFVRIVPGHLSPQKTRRLSCLLPSAKQWIAVTSLMLCRQQFKTRPYCPITCLC